MAQRKQILIIDDDTAMCQLLGKLLASRYGVVSKNDGLSALQWLSEGNLPDLVITDLDMPKIAGEEFVSNLKNSGFFSDIPLIVITGYKSRDKRLACFKLGVHEYFEKPFNPRDLVFAVDIILKHSQEKQKVF
jgi:DNA-binding NtrC family response regulator